MLSKHSRFEGKEMKTSNFLILFIGCTVFLYEPLYCFQEKKIVIISASYNNSSWCEKYFHSIVTQEYENWILIYIDDNSSDDTYYKMQRLIYEYNVEHKVILIKNSRRHGHLFNHYYAIHSCNKSNVIAILDGDDWFAHEHVLEKINEVYQDDTIWLTYGQFWYLKKNRRGFCKSIPPKIIETNKIRELSWRTSHLRTFYAGLFHAIHYEDLLYEGTFFPRCADVATMLPMIEMAGFHIKFIPDVLYIYNDNNPYSFHHDPTIQQMLEAHIKSMRPYLPLKERPW